MKAKTRERIYLAVTVLCLLLCAVLLLSVLLDRPVFGGFAAEHAPVLRPTALRAVDGGASGGQEASAAPPPAGLVLTEDALQQLLSERLPEGFPRGTVGVDIEEEGAVGLSMRVRRAELIDYLESTGLRLSFRQSLALRLLPRTLELELSVGLEGEDGALRLVPRALELNEEEIDLTGLPTGLFDVVDAALRAALEATGYPFRTLRFTDDAVILQ